MSINIYYSFFQTINFCFNMNKDFFYKKKKSLQNDKKYSN